MPTFNPASMPLPQRLEGWAREEGVSDPGSLSPLDLKRAAAELAVSVDDVLAARDELVATAADATASAGAATARDRVAASGADAGFGGTRLDSSPAFGRFAFDDAAVVPESITVKSDWTDEETTVRRVPGLPGAPGDPLTDLTPGFRTFPRAFERALALSEVAGVRVERASIQRFEGARNEWLHKDALTTVDVAFGKLDRASFDKLHAEFGGHSQVEFDATREYTAVDFMPPLVQALVNQDLQPKDRQELPGTADFDMMMMPRMENKALGVTTNCHGTAWGAARAFQDAAGSAAAAPIFFGDALRIEGLVGEHFEPLHELDASEIHRLDALDLKPGDVVQFENISDWASMTSLLHTAVYAGGGLFFEKPDTEMQSEDSPYRLATTETMSAPVSDFAEGTYKVKVLRAKRELPPAREAFRSGFSEMFEAYAKVNQRSLGLDAIIEQSELSAGGGMLGVYPSGLLELPLTRGADGRARIQDD